MTLLNMADEAASQKDKSSESSEKDKSTNNSPFSRFGSRPGTASNNSGSRFNSRFATNRSPAPAIIPTHKEAAVFTMKALGDPFYRLLSYPINTEYGDVNKLVDTLTAGGERVEQLKGALDDIWHGYALNGAALVSIFNPNIWNSMTHPILMPDETPDWLQDDNEEKEPARPTKRVATFRVLDPGLALNVLARARSQLLLANAPLIFDGRYLLRQLISDDPRLVALAKATGAMEVSHD